MNNKDEILIEDINIEFVIAKRYSDKKDKNYYALVVRIDDKLDKNIAFLTTLDVEKLNLK